MPNKYFKIPTRIGIFCFWMVGQVGWAQQTLPDILFYISDDLGYYDCRPFAKTEVKTPHLESLSRGGLTFTHAFVVSPSCAPSRGALLTGLMPARNGAEANHTYPRSDVLLLFKKLQEAGYEVVAFGKIAHASMNQKCGFDYYEAADDTNIYQKVAKFLMNRRSTKPLCLLVGDRRPHVPWTPILKYDPDKIKLPSHLLDTPDTRRLRALYYSDITNMDNDLGRIIDLTHKYFRKDPIRIFSSDHGAQWPLEKWNLYDGGIRTPLIFNWSGKIKKGQTSTAFVSWIDIFPTLLDLLALPTLAGLDGKSFKKVIFNPSLPHREAIYTTHSGDGNINVYPMRSIRTAKYKLIVNLYPDNYHTTHSDFERKPFAGMYWHQWDSLALNDPTAQKKIRRIMIRPAEEFYDLMADPKEEINLITKEELAATIQQMRHQLYEWMAQQGDKKQVFGTLHPINEGVPKKKNVDKE